MYFIINMDKEYGKLRVKPSADIKKVVKRKVKDKVNDMKVTVLSSKIPNKLNEFLEIYKEDPYVASVYYRNGGDVTKFNNSNEIGLYKERLVLLEFSNGDFEINWYRTKFGMSKTNRVYTSQKKTESILYKKKRFWYINNESKVKTFKPLTYNILNHFSGFNYFKEFLKDKFFWFKTYLEYDLNEILILNSVVIHKLYGHSDMDRYLFKTNKHVIKAIRGYLKRKTEKQESKDFDFDADVEYSYSYFSIFEFINTWKRNLPIIDNIDSITEDFFFYKYYNDTFSLAHKLGKRINAKWGHKKFVEMHDTWGYELSRILLKTVKCYDLKILDVYRDFAEFSGYRLLTTNHEVFNEGIEKRHCVGSYIDSIESGSCAIFSVNGRYTLQMMVFSYEKTDDRNRTISVKPFSVNRFMSNTYFNESTFSDTLKENFVSGYKFLHNNQFKGYKNDVDLPSDELVQEVNKKILEYNLSGRINDFKLEGLAYNVNDENYLCEDIVF